MQKRIKPEFPPSGHWLTDGNDILNSKAKEMAEILQCQSYSVFSDPLIQLFQAALFP